MTLQEWGSLGDFLTGCGTIVLAGAAFFGIGMWKLQLVAKDRYELARRVLRKVYEVEQAINAHRSPYLSHISEHGGEMIPPSNEELELQLRPIREAMASFAVDRREGELIWGSEIADAFKELEELVSEIFQAASCVNHEGVKDLYGYDDADVSEILWGNKNGKREFAKRVSDAINRITALVSVDLQPSWWRLLQEHN